MAPSSMKDSYMNFDSLRDREFFLKSDFPPRFPQDMRDADRWKSLADRFDTFQATRRDIGAPRIPHLIHQIWLGGPLPELYKPLTESWRRFNPGWEYRLWDEKSILAFGLENERSFKSSPNFGAKSDIARYEILERLGGFYADTDFECLGSLDALADSATFVAGTNFDASPEINNALIGVVPHHPLFPRLIEGLSAPIRSADGMEILALSGPRYLTRAFFEMDGSLLVPDIVLPSTYFYPFPNYEEAESSFPATRDKYAKPWSLAIHYWEASWLKPSPLRQMLSRVKRGILARLR